MKNVFDVVNALHKKVKRFFIGSVDGDGFPNIKAVLPVNKRNSVAEIYFSTNTSSRHVAQYRANPKACVYFFDPLLFRGVMLKGMIEVCEDSATKERFWNKGDTKYYPKGVSDPDYCILRFRTQTGRYYAGFKSEDFSVTAE
jgi:general stress protein 26